MEKLVHIIPTIELGGILQGTTNFTSNRIKLLIQYGYDDTVKVLEQNNKIVGAHIISKEASSLLPIFQYAIEKEIPYKELLDLTYAHPTFAEIISDALLNLDNKAINTLKQ